MKNLILLSFIYFSLAETANSQFTQYCGSPRYDTEIFSAVQTTSNVVYGSSVTASGSNLTLVMDIYQPLGDTATIRPLIIWAHGGSFVGGSKNDNDVVLLSEHFAKRGYVCASIDYRLGMSVFPPDAVAAQEAVYRAVQDMKAAVRFFRKDAAISNAYKIDPSVIFAGGSSAGAFTALHLAYLDLNSEIPAGLDTNILGGLEGTSGNPGYSSSVNAVVNLCGAIGDKSWIYSMDEPVVSMHGTNDQTVPYSTNTIIFLGLFPIMVVDGSYALSTQANITGLINEMYTYYGAGHVPYAANAAYMDTTVRFVSNFLYRYLGCNPDDPSPMANTFTSTGISSLSVSGSVIYPNPAKEEIRIQLNNVPNTPVKFLLFDSVGKIVIEELNVYSSTVFNLQNLPAGFYIYLMEDGKNTTTGHLIKL